MTDRTPTTETGRGMLRRLNTGTGIPRPYAEQSDRGSWESDILAIEDEARAPLVAALRKIADTTDWKSRIDAVNEAIALSREDRP
jgi:hypothetical protein